MCKNIFLGLSTYVCKFHVLFWGKNAYQVVRAWAWLRIPIETQRVTNCQLVYELHGRDMICMKLGILEVIGRVPAGSEVEIFWGCCCGSYMHALCVLRTLCKISNSYDSTKIRHMLVLPIHSACFAYAICMLSSRYLYRSPCTFFYYLCKTTKIVV